MAKRIVSGFVSITLAAVLSGGCATGGAANANAANSTARGGDAQNDTRLSLNLSLGDAVAHAAADAVASVMNPASALGAITAQTKEQAVQAGVNAGLAQAQKEGKVPTDEQKKELQDSVTRLTEAQAQQPSAAAK